MIFSDTLNNKSSASGSIISPFKPLLKSTLLITPNTNLTTFPNIFFHTGTCFVWCACSNSNSLCNGIKNRKKIRGWKMIGIYQIGSKCRDILHWIPWENYLYRNWIFYEQEALVGSFLCLTWIKQGACTYVAKLYHPLIFPFYFWWQKRISEKSLILTVISRNWIFSTIIRVI